ncbi:hypothetical protein C8J57DRAFT_1492851 [Mycena rebaudengoi]|nr:hypothetical protein C8J57DRAFT_1492851 [Mycena rebaudengoi]
MFSSITHLELMDDDFLAYNDESWKSLVSLPCLTHLAFNYYFDIPVGSLHLLLEERKLLQVLISIVEYNYYNDFFNDTVTDNPPSALPTHDARFFARTTSSA